jgi:hypothetical protein
VIRGRRELKKLQELQRLRERELSIARVWRLSANPKWITESGEREREREREREIFMENENENEKKK